MPELHVITGSNGAGKSSVGPIYLPQYIRDTCTVFDGDKLFMNLQREMWQQGMRANKEIRKIAYGQVVETFEGLVEKSIAEKADFVYEGHFTNDETWATPRRFKEEEGYRANLYFFGLTNTELSNARVLDRSKEGGHYVQPATVADNFYGNLEKMDKHFRIFDNLKIFDTSTVDHILLVEIEQGAIVDSVTADALPAWFTENLPTISGLFKMM